MRAYRRRFLARSPPGLPSPRPSQAAFRAPSIALPSSGQALQRPRYSQGRRFLPRGHDSAPCTHPASVRPHSAPQRPESPCNDLSASLHACTKNRRRKRSRRTCSAAAGSARCPSLLPPLGRAPCAPQSLAQSDRSFFHAGVHEYQWSSVVAQCRGRVSQRSEGRESGRGRVRGRGRQRAEVVAVLRVAAAPRGAVLWAVLERGMPVPDTARRGRRRTAQ